MTHTMLQTFRCYEVSLIYQPLRLIGSYYGAWLERRWNLGSLCGILMKSGLKYF